MYTMARQKKSLFEWLTGSTGADDLSFDDLESGTAFPAPAHKKAAHPASHSSKRSVNVPISSSDNFASAVSEPEPEGELAVDMYQTPSHIILKAMIAGVRPEDLEVSITRDLVTVRGKRERATEGHAGEFYFQELYWGSFSRTISLPQEIDVDEAEAIEKHGLLILKLPKMDKKRQSKLKVKMA